MPLLNCKTERQLPFEVRFDGKRGRVKMMADPYNSRMILNSFAGNPAYAAKNLLQVAQAFGFGKVGAFVKAEESCAFSGYAMEGRIPGYFAGEDALCFSAYTKKQRGISRNPDVAEKIMALTQKIRSERKHSAASYKLRVAAPSESTRLAVLYQAIFRGSYPTPVSDPAYLGQLMKKDTVFCYLENQGDIIGAASLEMDIINKNGEVTDCAVLPASRGQGLLARLVNRLEEESQQRGISSLYSLSRAFLPGINIVLSDAGFRWHGRLINNCRICGDYEDMNIWQKFNGG
jgi:beta-lysine N6-acetyltransferase